MSEGEFYQPMDLPEGQVDPKTKIDELLNLIRQGLQQTGVLPQIRALHAVTHLEDRLLDAEKYIRRLERRLAQWEPPHRN